MNFLVIDKFQEIFALTKEVNLPTVQQYNNSIHTAVPVAWLNMNQSLSWAKKQYNIRVVKFSFFRLSIEFVADTKIFF